MAYICVNRTIGAHEHMGRGGTFMNYEFAWDNALKIMVKMEDLLFESKVNTSSRYKKFGYWMLKSNSYKNALKLSSYIPGLSPLPNLNPYVWPNSIKNKDWGSIAGPLLGYSLIPTVEASIKAEAIWVFGNIVAIYCSDLQHYVVKTGATQKGCEKVLHEAQMLKWLKENIKTHNTGVFFPSILNIDYHDHPFHVTSLIKGQIMEDYIVNQFERHINKPFFCKKYLDRVLDFIWLIYKTYGITYKQLSDVYPALMNWEENINSKVKSFDKLTEKIMGLFYKSDALIKDNRMIPCSLVHQDLVMSNVIIGEKDDIWIIDWESTKFAPIIKGLEPMLNRLLCSQSKYYMNSNCCNSNTYTFEEQRVLENLSNILNYFKVSHKQEEGLSKKALMLIPQEVRRYRKVIKQVAICENILKQNIGVNYE